MFIRLFKFPAQNWSSFGSRFGVPGGLLLVTLTLAAGCQNPNAQAMLIGQPPKDLGAVRVAQTRDIKATDQITALSNVTQTLQDLGFAIQESSGDLGVVTGTKERDAEESGQVAGQVALTVVFALMGAYYAPVWDKTQEIHVTTVITPTPSPTDYSVRVSFDRYLTNNQGQLWRTELIQDPAIYQEFFQRLARDMTLKVL